jgi:hypothetical protein
LYKAAQRKRKSCYHVRVATERTKKFLKIDPAELALCLPEALHRDRIIPRFVDSYVVENGRQALQVHASLYRDLLTLLQREALLAVSARALELVFTEPQLGGKGKNAPTARKDSASFRRKFLAALARQQKWNAGDALDFQSDLRRYEELIARTASTRQSRKPFEAANHPFVDRCAFVLDSSFLEKARVAASRALKELEDLATRIAAPSFQEQELTRVPRR